MDSSSLIYHHVFFWDTV